MATLSKTLTALILLMAVARGANTPEPTLDEYHVKAGFLATFASFVDWPEGSFKGPQEPVRICVLGRSPFGNSLDILVAGKVVGGRTLVARSIADVREADGCHILFISSSEHLRLRSILDALSKQSVLSVGDTSDFISEGGIVNLRIDAGRVRIDINSDAAKERRLRISSHLLELARKVKR